MPKHAPQPRASSSRPKRKLGRHSQTTLAPSERPSSATAGELETPSETPSRPGNHGGRLLTGNPGNKGGGRPPNWLRDWCDDLLANETSKKQVEEILQDKSHPAFAQMWRSVGDRAHGKPPQSVTHEAGATLLEAILDASMRSI